MKTYLCTPSDQDKGYLDKDEHIFPSLSHLDPLLDYISQHQFATRRTTLITVREVRKMSKVQSLTIGKRVMQQLYEHFEKNLFSTYSCVLGKLLSQGVLGERFMYQIQNTRDCDQAFHLLLDHLCEQDLENLHILVEVLNTSGTEECLPGHTLLAEILKYKLSTVGKDAELTTRISHPVNCETSHPPTLSSCVSGYEPTCLPTALQASLEDPSSIRIKAEPHTACEYPELVSSLLYFFDAELKEDETTTFACRDLMAPTQATSVRLGLGMPLIKFSGPLKGRTHRDLVILLWRLGGSDPTNCNLAYQLIQGKKQQLPIDLQIINVLGAVYATSDNAHLFQEALEWTKRPDCMNPVYLQCRLNYLLSICTTSDRDLSQQYLKQAQELSVMCEPDFTTALLAMQEARTILLRIEEHNGHLDEEVLKQINRVSDRACDICRALPNWMQPFAVVVTLLKLQLDARTALLLSKSGNHLGAIAAISPLSHLIRDVEKPNTFCHLIPRQRALYHYVKTIISVINKDREAAMTNAIKSRSLYMKVGSVEPACKIMEIVGDEVT